MKKKISPVTTIGNYPENLLKGKKFVLPFFEGGTVIHSQLMRETVPTNKS